MKLFEGGSLAQQAAGLKSDPRAAARLVAQVARAVHHAHQRGILHRDLKPANILLDEQGQPHVTDFGLAKRVEGAAELTQSGAVLGTPSYMAPEQARGDKGLSVAADVYALGAILYECLTGSPPFCGESPVDTLLQVIEREPVGPCQMNPGVPRDLETICLKCLDKLPLRRYGSAAELADDLERWQQGETIRARPAGTLERCWKWARRRPALAALLAVSAAAAAALLGVALYFTDELARQRTVAVEERNEAVRLEGVAQEERRQAEQERERTKQQKAEVEQQKQVVEREREEKAHQLEQSRRALFASQVWRVAGLLDRDAGHGRRLLDDADTCPLHLRDFAWGYYQRRCEPNRGRLPFDRGGYRVASTADGKSLALLRPGRFEVWDVGTRRRRSTRALPPGRHRFMAFSPDGATLALPGKEATTITLWDVPSARQRATLAGHSGEVKDVAFSPDSKSLVSCSMTFDHRETNRDKRFKNGEVLLWDVLAGRLKRTLLSKYHSGIQVVAFMPSGHAVAYGTTHGSDVKLLDVKTRKHLGDRFHALPGWIYAVAVSPDGQTLAYTSASETVRVCDVRTRRERFVLYGLDPRELLFSPDSKTLATFDVARPVIKLWDVATGRERLTLRGVLGGAVFTPDSKALIGADGQVCATAARPDRDPIEGKGFLAVALGPDGKTLVASTQDEKVRVLDIDSGKEQPPVPIAKDTTVRFLALTRDGRTLIAAASTGNDSSLQLWDLPDRKRRGTLNGHQGAIAALDLSADDRLLVTAGADKTVRLWDLATRREVDRLEGNRGIVPAVAFAPDGRTVAVAEGLAVKLWDVGQRRVRGTLRAGVATPLSALAFAPDGATLAAATGSGEVVLWKLATGEARVNSDERDFRARALAFSPDGRALVVGRDDRTVHLRDPVTGHLRAILHGHRYPVTALAFSRHGGRLVSASAASSSVWFIRSGEIRVWDATTPPPVLQVLHGQAGPHGGLAVSPDGQALVSAGERGTIKVWGAGGRLRTALPSPLPAPGRTWSLALSGDGKLLASANEKEREVRLWDMDTGQLRALLPGHPPTHTHCVALAPDGQTLASSSCNNIADKTVKLWDVASRVELACFSTAAGVNALAFGQGGRTLVAAGDDGMVQRWDVASRRPRPPLRGHTGRVLSLAVSPDGRTLASSGADQTVRLWGLASAREVATRRVVAATGDRAVAITALAFSSDGKLLAGGGDDRTVRLWDVAARRERATLEGYPGAITALAFLPDGKTLVSADSERVLLSDVATTLKRIPAPAWFPEVARLNALIDAEPGNAAHYAARAQLLVAAGQGQEALVDFTRATALHPADWQVYRNSARAHEAAGQWEGAADAWSGAIACKNSPATLRNDRARVLRRLGWWRQAAVNLGKWLEAKPGDLDPGLTQFACALLLSGDESRYRLVCRQALARHRATKEPRACFALARVCLLAPGGIAEAAQAIRLAQQAVDALPNAWHRHTLGLAFYRAGQYQEAAACFRQSLKDTWWAPLVNWLGLALVEKRLGKEQEARRWLDQAGGWLDRAVREMQPETATPSGLYANEWLEALILRREAEALLDPKKAR
jgi:WD40 repeat protein